jgi:hypothetical protein
MFRDAREVLDLIGPRDRVLDLGGAVEVFPRADVVLDAQAYEKRTPGQLGHLGERFTRENWFVGDVCSRAAWSRFPDKSFDFVLCSHLLEDVRDPVFVCEQLVRVGRAGYIECPSRFRECARAHGSDVHAGYNHHRWIVDAEDDRIVFTAKLHWADLFDYLGDARRHALGQPRNTYVGIHWTGSFDFVERAPKGPPIEAENLFLFYDRYDYEATDPLHTIVDVAHRGASFEWVDAYLLPIEQEEPAHVTVERFQQRLREQGRRLP